MTVFSASSHPGRKHELNEDSIGWSEVDSLWLVADGMGGHAAGEVASLIAKNTILGDVAAGIPLKDAVLNAHLAVSEAASLKSEQAGMGTTIVAARIDANVAELVWVGDSRVYLWRDNVLDVVTTDHSFMQMLLANQQITPEEAHSHPQRNIVTQVLGVSEPKPDRLELPLQLNDWLLLCSDGLNDELLDEEIALILKQSKDTETAVQALIEAACNSGGRDNVSAIIMQIETKPMPASEPVTLPRGTSDNVLPLDLDAETEHEGQASIVRNPLFLIGLGAALLLSAFWYFMRGI